MDGKEYVKSFWDKIDKGLKMKDITMTVLATDLGIKRETIYTQKRRNQLPKAEHLVAMLEYLDLDAAPKESIFAEYIPYLERAEEWKIKAIRELLGMPELVKKNKVDAS